MTNQPLSAIGVDQTNQTVVLWIGWTTDHLVLTPEQAEMLGNELLTKAKFLKAQQSN